METISLSFSDGDFSFLRKLQAQLFFDNLEKMILFQAEISDTLLRLNESGERFFSGIAGKPESYREIKFEFEPI